MYIQTLLPLLVLMLLSILLLSLWSHPWSHLVQFKGNPLAKISWFLRFKIYIGSFLANNIIVALSKAWIPCTDINRKCFLIDADEFIVECIEGHFSSLAPNFSQYKLAMGCKWIGSNSFLEGAKINYGD